MSLYLNHINTVLYFSKVQYLCILYKYDTVLYFSKVQYLCIPYKYHINTVLYFSKIQYSVMGYSTLSRMTWYLYDIFTSVFTTQHYPVWHDTCMTSFRLLRGPKFSSAGSTSIIGTKLLKSLWCFWLCHELYVRGRSERWLLESVYQQCVCVCVCFKSYKAATESEHQCSRVPECWAWWWWWWWWW